MNEFTLKDYKKLFENLYPQLSAFAYKYLNDWEFSKGVVEEVFVKVWEDKITFQNKDHATGFFYKTVKNECLHFLKVTEHYESPHK
ncbi:sigma factor [Flavivirga spongiicola]|uniref:RNA polymerase sigma-70 region 2 domain-containing protein n=1 Tax=Flavivirga spongiicola TaxID=421621 RepID=A0ABU7XSE4_9FLAO|nr:sigma factor [Flavivirga sp. MEBiC05379]MDO5978700.1 sigma factor [Flavivirga sp. MEBiC05379]